MQNSMEILCKIRNIYHAIGNIERQLQEAHGICLNEGSLLACLDTHGKCTAGQIAQMLDLSASNTSKIIASMEKKGLVGRLRGNSDKRRMFFSLTPAGLDMLKSLSGQTEQAKQVLQEIKEL